MKQLLRSFLDRTASVVLVISACAAFLGQPATGGTSQLAGTPTATGKSITPTAAAGAIFQDLLPGHADAPHMHANNAAAVTISPDGRLLAILTTGHNVHYDDTGKLIPELSTEYVFLFDITTPRPKQLQVLDVKNTFHGIAWGTRSDRLYVAGGQDDLVAEYARSGSTFARTRTFMLGHHAMNGKPEAFGPRPTAAQLAISPDGTRLLVSNSQNDSVSLVDLRSGHIAEQDLRPGKIDPRWVGQPGGSYPGSIVWVSNDRAYVASERDRELVALETTANVVHVLKRIPVDGQPVAVIANRAGSRVYAALDNVDRVAILDTRSDAVIEQVAVLAPESVYINPQKLGGANPTALALTPDQQVLLVTNGGQNAVAVVTLSELATGVNRKSDDAEKRPPRPSAVAGLIPTGWYPTGVAISRNAAAIYVVNGKSMTGPNAQWCTESAAGKCYGTTPPHFPGATTAPDGRRYAYATNGNAFLSTKGQAILQLQRAGFLTIPTPGPAELARLTSQVARNNGFDRPDKTAEDAKLFAFLRDHIKHVIYIVKENRSYDQILGDLDVGNGDPRLALFPEPLTPNHHALARNFVDLDNFLVSGEGSWTGHQWLTGARTSVFAERNDFATMAERGGDYAVQGMNRNLNMALPTNELRRQIDPDAPLDPDILPGVRDVAELDGPGGEKGEGYIWDAVLRVGLTVRNYGLITRGGRPVEVIRQPYQQHRRVADASSRALMNLTDPYFYGVDGRIPDFWRIQEWKREFELFSKNGDLPDLNIMWLPGDHFGAFDSAIDGVNTPDTQIADNDYALGQVVEAVAKSPFANSTVIISIEDDTWDGVDHVDAFRSPIFFAGAFVRQHAVVSTRYTTVNVVKTIAEILGTGPLSINDAMAAPMSDVFDPGVTAWSYTAKVPGILHSTKLPIPPIGERAEVCQAGPRHSARYWTKAMADQDFSDFDAGEFGAGNHGLWQGMQGDVPYPEVRTGENLRENRAALLARFQSTSSDGDCHSVGPK